MKGFLEALGISDEVGDWKGLTRRKDHGFIRGGGCEQGARCVDRGSERWEVRTR